MAKQKFRRKDLRAPDEFVTLAARLTAWVQQRRKQGAWVAAVLAAVAGGLVLTSAFRSARARDANADLGRALSAIRSHDFVRAERELKDVAARWNPSLPGQIASALAPSAQLRRGEIDATIASVESALSATPDLPAYLRQQLQYAWAVALEEKGQLKDAAERYAAAAAAEGPYRGPAVLGEARVREQLDDTVRARELYRRYVEEFPDMPDRELVEPKLRS